MNIKVEEEVDRLDLDGGSNRLVKEHKLWSWFSGNTRTFVVMKS